MWKCKHCQKEFDFSTVPQKSNHTRWCKENPSPSYKNLADKRKAEGIEYVSPLKGKKNEKWKPHTDETKELLRRKALESSHRRLKRNTVIYNGVRMDSSWEVELAKRLDDLKIKWERPSPLSWKDDQGIMHHYFPDFYLPAYNLYLDPKNPAAVYAQKMKLEKLSQQYENIVIIKTLDEIKNWVP
jgi:hypothetical protein